MVFPRSILVAALLGALAGAAAADVIILKENDVPLAGRIIRETEDALEFQLKGLGRRSAITVEKSRVRRWWREDDSRWMYARQESERMRTLRKLRGEKEPGYTEWVPPEPRLPPVRSGGEIRRDLLGKAVERLNRIITDHALIRTGWIMSLFFLGTLLLFAGGKVADLTELHVGKAGVLSLITLFLVAAAFFLQRELGDSSAMPGILACEVFTFLLLTKWLSGGTLSKAILLLSFFLASLLLLAGSLFSVLIAF